jgi:hypothetical protein
VNKCEILISAFTGCLESAVVHSLNKYKYENKLNYQRISNFLIALYYFDRLFEMEMFV